jgi:hypothetical protein
MKQKPEDSQNCNWKPTQISLNTFETTGTQLKSAIPPQFHLISPFDTDAIPKIRKVLHSRQTYWSNGGTIGFRSSARSNQQSSRGQPNVPENEGLVTPHAFTRNNSSEYLFTPRKKERTVNTQVTSAASERAELSSRVSGFISMMDTQSEFLKVPHKLKKVMGRLHVVGC